MKNKLAQFAAQHDLNIVVLESTGSTNDIAREQIYNHSDVIIADCQSNGRGQRGNSWESRPGENLTFSIVLEPDFLPAESQFLLSEAVALGVVDMLGSLGIKAQVKWTNDIYVAGRKIAGILIENDVCGANLSRSIVGIGLNVNQNQFSEALPNPTSMALATNLQFDRMEVFKNLYISIMDNYKSLEQGYSDEIEGHYHKSLYRRGERHRYLTAEKEEFYATIEHVEPSGELVMRHEDGSKRGYLFKEIEFTI